FRRIQCHGFFTKDCFALFECGERDLHVSGWRRDDADEIDVRMSHQLLPIVRDVLDTKLFRNRLGAIAITTGDRDYLSAHAIAKPRDLRSASKPRPNDSNSNR